MARNKFKNRIRMRHQLVRNRSAVGYLPEPPIRGNKICIADCTSFRINILGNIFGFKKMLLGLLVRQKTQYLVQILDAIDLA